MATTSICTHCCVEITLDEDMLAWARQRVWYDANRVDLDVPATTCESGDYEGEPHEPEPYPEHVRLHHVAEEAGVIGEFLDTCGYVLCEVDKRGEYQALNKTVQQVLADHFHIDLDRLETEKREILEAQRRLNEQAETSPTDTPERSTPDRG